MQEPPFVSVVVPTRKRPHLLSKCLDSLLRQEYPPHRWEIIVVEDGSTDGRTTVEAQAKKTEIPIHYFSIARSGAAVARNVGLQKAKGEIIAYVDDDAMCVPGWLARISERLLEEKVAAVGGRVSSDYPEDSFRAELTGRGELLWTGINCQIESPQPAEFLPGGNFAFRRTALQDAGGFDPNFSKRGAWREDTDACIGVRRQGYRLLFDSEIKVYHLGARWLHPLERVKPILVWCMTRDDGYFRAKNFGWQGVLGALESQARQAGTRLVLAAANFVLIFVHLLAWIPGAWLGLLRQRARTGP